MTQWLGENNDLKRTMTWNKKLRLLEYIFFFLICSNYQKKYSNRCLVEAVRCGYQADETITQIYNGLKRCTAIH